MKDDVRDILVREVMSRRPKVGTQDMTVHQAARAMRSARVGSLVILDEGRPIGILTERDVVNKVVAEGKNADRVTVAEAMSSPVITASPDDKVSEAARRMAQMKVRRLPVVQGGELVGMLTENDILRLSPTLIEMTREWSKLLIRPSDEKDDIRFSGYCELCDAYSTELRESDGQMICPECFENG